jgi:hypothetical protein
MPGAIESAYIDLHARQQVIHLRALIFQRFKGMDRETRLRDKALQVAHMDMDRRLEGMNQFREELTRNTLQYINKDEYSANHQALELRIEQINTSNEQRLRALERLVYIGVGAAIIINGVAMYFLRK